MENINLREIDAQVAVVLGWTDVREQESFLQNKWTLSEDINKDYYGNPPDKFRVRQQVPSYSTWQSVNQIIDKTDDFDLGFNPDRKHWYCYLYIKGIGMGYVKDEASGPIAVCKALLNHHR